jgi:hypothetical protein
MRDQAERSQNKILHQRQQHELMMEGSRSCLDQKNIITQCN